MHNLSRWLKNLQDISRQRWTTLSPGKHNLKLPTITPSQILEKLPMSTQCISILKLGLVGKQSLMLQRNSGRPCWLWVFRVGFLNSMEDRKDHQEEVGKLEWMKQSSRRLWLANLKKKVKRTCLCQSWGGLRTLTSKVSHTLWMNQSVLHKMATSHLMLSTTHYRLLAAGWRVSKELLQIHWPWASQPSKTIQTASDLSAKEMKTFPEPSQFKVSGSKQKATKTFLAFNLYKDQSKLSNDTRICKTL